MTEEREIVALGKADRFVPDNEPAELDEMIAAAARAELRPRLSFICDVTLLTLQSASMTSC